MTFDSLAQRLAPHYSRFRVSERLLMTGHSHQAWPDVAREGQLEAFDVAARDVDAKWAAAFEKAEVLRGYLRDYYDDPTGRYTFSANTHDLVVRWLSSLDLKARSHVITTDGEFHSLTRQLRRLQEVGLGVTFLPASPSEGFVERLESALTERTAAVCLSRVYFKTGLVQPHLTAIAALCRQAGVPLLIDDYHGTHAVPLSLRDAGLEDCFLVSGGYKYLQWGEGNCFLRFPSGCALRPVVTGWFASFDTLADARGDQPVSFDQGDERFAGATFDPTSQFRAARVVAFFREQGLTPEVLRAHSQAQIGWLREQFMALGLDENRITLMHQRPIEENGGFLALRSPEAQRLKAALLERGVATDARDDSLRFGPAPYTTQAQLEAALGHLAEAVRELG
ncbi:MAG: hypothetical protein CMH57_05410 [Myxococcales bacterium]|nr:hypothetical protein [Myxococcales bacterium]